MPNDLGSSLPNDLGSSLPNDLGSLLPNDLGSLLPNDLGSLLPNDLGSLLPADLGGLLPGDTGRYAPLVRTALVAFVGALPAEAQAEVFRRQLALPTEAPLEVRLFTLLASSPTLHKLGQVVARDGRLHTDLRRSLQQLETMPPQTPVATVHKNVRSELETSGVDLVEIRLSEQLLAEASVATVLPFRWKPDSADPVDGVFKILKPGVAKQLTTELSVLPRIGELLERESRSLGLPTPDYGDAFEQVTNLLSQEIQLSVEQANLSSMSQEFDKFGDVAIPKLLPFSTPQMTAMTRLHGRKITEAASDPRAARRLARTLAQALIVQPLLAPVGNSAFHADPHAGNLLQTDDGKLGILDWALTGTLEKSERVDISRLVIATLNLDAKRMARIVENLADAPLDRAAALLPIRSALQALRLGDIPTLSSLFTMLDQVATDASVRFGGNLILFRKSLHSVQGVLEDLSPGFSLDAFLVQKTIEQALRDLPRRWFSGPLSNRYGTHLSNLDIARLLGSGPATALRLLRR